MFDPPNPTDDRARSVRRMIKDLIARLRCRSTTAPVTPEEWTVEIERLSARPVGHVLMGSVRVLRDPGPVPVAKRALFVAALLEMAAARLDAERERKGRALH